jgi:hypothetical protein
MTDPKTALTPPNTSLRPAPLLQVYLAEWTGCQVAVKELMGFSNATEDTKAMQVGRQRFPQGWAVPLRTS